MTVPLPPLPPVDGDADEAYRPGGRSVLDVLGEEHEQLLALCRELVDPALADERRRQVAEVLTATVARHLSAEEQYLYPTVRAVLPDGAPLTEREINADTAIQRALKELGGSGPDDERFGRLAAEVAAGLDRHVRGARDELFPRLRANASDVDLIRLGNRVEIAEEAAPTRPHPGSPAAPPWNRLVEPAVGVVDKVRDAVTRRPTYVDDLPDESAELPDRSRM